MGITATEAYRLLSDYNANGYPAREWRTVKIVSMVAVAILVVVSVVDIVLRPIKAFEGLGKAGLALSAAILKFFPHASELKFLWLNTRFYSHMSLERKLAPQLPDHALHGNFLKSLVRLNTTFRPQVLRQLSFTQLVEAGEGLGPWKLTALLQGIASTTVTQLWRGLEELPRNTDMLKGRITALGDLRDLDDFNDFMFALDRKLEKEKRRDQVASELVAVAPFLKLTEIDLGSRGKLTVPQTALNALKEGFKPEMVANEEDYQAFQRIMRYYRRDFQNLNLKNWLYDLKYVKTHFKDNGIATVERAYPYFEFNPPRLADYEKMVETYQTLNLATPTLERIRSGVEHLYKKADRKLPVIEHYRYAVKYGLDEMARSFRLRILPNPGVINQITERIKPVDRVMMGWEMLSDADFAAGFNHWTQNHLNRPPEQPDTALFRRLFTFFSTKNDAKATLVMDALKNEWTRYSEAGRLLLYPPLDTPETLLAF